MLCAHTTQQPNDAAGLHNLFSAKRWQDRAKVMASLVIRTYCNTYVYPRVKLEYVVDLHYYACSYISPIYPGTSYYIVPIFRVSHVSFATHIFMHILSTLQYETMEPARLLPGYPGILSYVRVKRVYSVTRT